MNDELLKFASYSLAPATKLAYQTGENKFLQFCNHFRVEQYQPIIPASETILCYFAVYLARTVKHDTIKAYLTAVKHLHLRSNFTLEWDKFVRLQYILRGIKRYQVQNPKPRLPIRKEHLQDFYNLLQPFTHTNYDNKMIWAAMCLAFFGFLRTSEFTVSQQFQQSEHLGLDDLAFFPSLEAPTHMSLTIKCSKTDPFRKGITLTLGTTESNVCAVKALKHYLPFRGKSPGPLFQFSNGRPLTRALFVKELHQLLAFSGHNSNHYNGHSFRIGAATSAAANGLPTWLIKDLGRWTSDCYERYIRTPTETLINASKRLAE